MIDALDNLEVESQPLPEVEFRPYENGPQEQFLASSADIVVYGGGAGGGKSWALILDALRWQDLKVTVVMLRRTYPMIFNPGGLWDTCEQVCPYFDLAPKVSDASWVSTSSGFSIKLSHLQHDKDKINFQGAALPIIDFDELTHFTSAVFWYMVSRNRLDRKLPIKPYIRATCNPDNNSWVYKELIWWWIDPQTGLPIKERSGILRYFVRIDGRLVWGDSREEVIETTKCPATDVKSFTFIPATVTDNKALMANDPGYLANLRSLPMYEREQLLNGNWKVKPSAGMRFRREWFTIITKEQARTLKAKHQVGTSVRYYDRAATEESASNKDPDATAGVKMCKLNGKAPYRYMIEDCRYWKARPAAVKANIATTAGQDGCENGECELVLEVDPGSAGVSEKHDLADYLAAFSPHFQKPTGSKWVRSGPMSAAAEQRLICVVEGTWNEPYLDEMEDFCDEKALAPGQKAPHDDRVDGSSGAFNRLAQRGTPGIN